MKTQIRNQRFGRKENGIGGKAHFDPVRLFGLMEGRVDFGESHDLLFKKMKSKEHTAVKTKLAITDLQKNSTLPVETS
jgi:hypothetical protein